MIIFNGAALESIAPVKIEDIRIGPIIQTPVARDRPIRAGAAFIRAHEGTRSVNVTFALMVEDAQTRQQYLDAITTWALSEQPAPLLLPNHTGRMLRALCTGLPEPSMRQWWEARLNLAFTAYDPFFYAVEEKSAACGDAFYIRGNGTPEVRITATLAAQTDPTDTDGTNTMTCTDGPAGELEINLTKQTARVDGVSIMDCVGFTSRFIIPKTGANTITGTGTVRWREAWQS